MGLWDLVIRLGLATLAGLLLGLDREIRGKSAGIRTHALVALSSALITVSAEQLYFEMRHEPGASIDPLRVVQGLAQAIGFIAAGTIFVARGNVHNLTSAANIWLAAALGIAAGLGQVEIVVLGLVFGLVVLSVVKLAERFVPGGDDPERRDDA